MSQRKHKSDAEDRHTERKSEFIAKEPVLYFKLFLEEPVGDVRLIWGLRLKTLGLSLEIQE